MDYVIGVDIGTQSTKALLVDQHGAIVAQHASSYQPDTPKPLWAEQWPAVWLKAVVECIAACVGKAKEAGVAAKSIKAVCVSSLYGGSGIPVDSEMRPLYPCLIWMDRRATDQVEWVRGNIDLERLYAITGNGVDSYYGYTKMLWLRDHEPDVWAHTRYFLPPNAYVIYMLTGEVAVDHSSAGNIGGIYDIAKRDWSDEALDMLGIPATMMPERLVESSDVVGGLLSQWAEQLGLEAGTAIVAGGVDAAVATFAAGVTRAGQHVAMIGTSMCWGYINQTVDARHGLDQHAACVQRAARYLCIRRRDYGGCFGDMVSRAVLSCGDRGGARDGEWGSASVAGGERFSDPGGFGRCDVLAVSDGRTKPRLGCEGEWGVCWSESVSHTGAFISCGVGGRVFRVETQHRSGT